MQRREGYSLACHQNISLRCYGRRNGEITWCWGCFIL